MRLVPRFQRPVGSVKDHVSIVVQDKQVDGSVPPVAVLDSEDVQDIAVAMGPMFSQCIYITSDSPDDKGLQGCTVHNVGRGYVGLCYERCIDHWRFDLG